MKPNVVKEENIKMFPLMIGTKLDSVRSLCVGSENYLAINSQVSENNQDASANFLTWLLFSEQGIKALNEMKMLSPYSTALQASPPIDKHGYVSLGTSVDATKAAIEMAKTLDMLKETLPLDGLFFDIHIHQNPQKMHIESYH